jgi:hypothetical protein
MGVLAGNAYGSGALGGSALRGAYFGMSVEATSNIYRGIKFPNIENQGKDFAYLFDECMTENGLHTERDRLLISGWKFTEKEIADRIGLRGDLILVKSSSTSSCEIELSYFNRHSAITNPTVEVTFFDISQVSLSEHILAYPSIFLGKSRSEKIEIPNSDCDLVQMAYVSSAEDQISGKEISELLGAKVEVCNASSSPCKF